MNKLVSHKNLINDSTKEGKIIKSYENNDINYKYSIEALYTMFKGIYENTSPMKIDLFLAITIKL